MKSTASIRAMLVASVSISAFALALAAPQTAAAAADEPATLGEVIVTAQKKSENINDVPLSVTAVSGQKLDPGIQLRPHLPAPLYPRSRQHRFRHQCLPAGVVHL